MHHGKPLNGQLDYRPIALLDRSLKTFIYSTRRLCVDNTRRYLSWPFNRPAIHFEAKSKSTACHFDGQLRESRVDYYLFFP